MGLYDILEKVLDQIPKCDKNILLRNFSGNLELKDLFKPTSGNKGRHEQINDNGVMSRKLCHIQKSVKSTMLPH
jgi:hypothetical protein